MNKSIRVTLALGFLLCSMLILSGCGPMAQFSKTIQLSAPMSPGSGLTAQTHNGSITVDGADVDDCDLTATVIARAGFTSIEAEKLADRVKVWLETSGNNLKVKIKKPTLLVNESVAVNLDVKVPHRTNLELTTHNGRVRIANITAEVSRTTHNGRITASQISGETTLRTHNGRITCNEISGDTDLKTHNGRIELSYSRAAPSVCTVSAVSYNGNIDFAGPPDFSAAVEASTHNGTVKTRLPVKVIEEVSKRRLRGTIGIGQGKLRLENHNGSINIR
jgi:DUF4097 and DUF4098 domain-containing protein YvlB